MDEYPFEILKNMFGLKNNSKQNVTNKEQTINEEICIHTMRDDLDVLEGKMIIQKDESKIFQSTRDKTSKIDNRMYPIGNVGSNEINPAEKSQLSSPFLSANIPKEAEKQLVITDKAEPILKKNENMIKPIEIRKENLESMKKNANSHGRLLFIAIISVIIIFAAGLYYFWLTRSNQEPDISSLPPIVETPKNPPVKIEPEIEKFTLDNPNYLRINLAEADAKNTLNLFSVTAKDILAEGINVPVEFVAVDENNNPISFQIFANVTGIKLPNSIMDNLGDFLIYFYSDTGNMRIGMKIKIKENSSASSIINLIGKEEKNLPDNLSSILLDPMVPDKGKIFKNGIYKNFAIRYMNLDAQETISVDYAITDNLWLIGTSKNTIRAILDKQ